MQKAYKAVYSDHPNQPGQLVANINPGNLNNMIFLQAGNKKWELLMQKGKIACDAKFTSLV